MMHFRLLKPMVSILAALLVPSFGSGARFEEMTLFQSGEDGYHTYRIPSLIVTEAGAVLAFCEGRKESRDDSGDIDLLVQRSEDGGETWSRAEIVWDDGANTCGNPCPVVDRETGRIIMLMSWNRGSDSGKDLHAGTANGTRRVYQCYSDDDGRTWTEAKEITEQAKDPSWWWYATGPGVGIQLERGPFQGRLVIPCNHTAPDNSFGAHTIYSDDGGETWQRSNPIKPTCNESQVVELADGRLMMNMRSQDATESNASPKRPRNGYRSVAYSEDGGATWTAPEFDDELGDPVCQASLIRYDDDCLLFSNPSPDIGPERGPRIRMTVRLSQDGGKSWPESLLVNEGGSAYSCLTRLPDGQIGLLYERTDAGRNYVLSLARIPLASLRD